MLVQEVGYLEDAARRASITSNGGCWHICSPMRPCGVFEVPTLARPSGDNSMFKCACKNGLLAYVQFILALGIMWNMEAAMYAAEGGNVECIKYVVSVFEDFSIPVHAPAVIKCAAKFSHLDCVKLLLVEPTWPREECLFYMTQGAARSGHMEILDYGIEQPSNRKILKFVMNEAAEGGHVNCMMYLHAQGCAYDAGHMICATSGGHLDVMKLLCALKVPSTRVVCHAAAEGGHLESLKYAHENGCPWRYRDMTGPFNEHEYNLIAAAAAAAVQAPTLDCLEYVLSQDAYLSPQCAHEAVISWSVAKLQFVHARGLTWRQESMDRAATWGWLEGVVFLHEVGVPWNEHTTEAAASNGHMELLMYALQHGCPASEHVLEMVRNIEQTQVNIEA